LKIDIIRNKRLLRSQRPHATTEGCLRGKKFQPYRSGEKGGGIGKMVLGSIQRNHFYGLRLNMGGPIFWYKNRGRGPWALGPTHGTTNLGRGMLGKKKAEGQFGRGGPGGTRPRGRWWFQGGENTTTGACARGGATGFLLKKQVFSFGQAFRRRTKRVFGLSYK